MSRKEILGYTEGNSDVQFTTCWQGSVVNNRTPGTRHLVHMETYNKLISSVGIQTLHRHALFGTVNKKQSYMSIW